MSKKRLPTNMHQVLDVEPFEEFVLDTCTQGEKPMFMIDKNGSMWRLSEGGKPNRARGEHVTFAINCPNRIIRRVPLTDEQVKLLRSFISLRLQYLVKDRNGDVYASKNAPQKGWEICCNTASGNSINLGKTTPVASLVDWSDPEPFNIAYALKWY